MPERDISVLVQPIQLKRFNHHHRCNDSGKPLTCDSSLAMGPTTTDLFPCWHPLFPHLHRHSSSEHVMDHRARRSRHVGTPLQLKEQCSSHHSPGVDYQALGREVRAGQSTIVRRTQQRIHHKRDLCSRRVSITRPIIAQHH